MEASKAVTHSGPYCRTVGKGTPREVDEVLYGSAGRLLTTPVKLQCRTATNPEKGICSAAMYVLMAYIYKYICIHMSLVEHTSQTVPQTPARGGFGRGAAPLRPGD